jgi:hypothetical protein
MHRARQFSKLKQGLTASPVARVNDRADAKVAHPSAIRRPSPTTQPTLSILAKIGSEPIFVSHALEL